MHGDMRQITRPCWGAVLIFALTACHALGSSYAERVDVPLSVRMMVTRTPKVDCAKNHCAISYALRISQGGTTPVYALDCQFRAVDLHGNTVIQGPFGFAPSGDYVGPGTPLKSKGSLDAGSRPLSPEERGRVNSLQGTCAAYVWHGSPPV